MARGILRFLLSAALLLGATAALAQAATPDSTVVAPDSLRATEKEDTVGLPGRLEGETSPPRDPGKIKQTLQRMGSREIEGMTEWERRKNPRVAMLCSALLPGLGQTYNGRRLKVGVMVGFASFYMGNIVLNYKRYEQSLARRDAAIPDSDQYRLQNELAEFYREEARTYLWWSGAVWLLGLLDSWIDAHLYDVRAYTPPATETSFPGGVRERVGYVTVGFDLELSR